MQFLPGSMLGDGHARGATLVNHYGKTLLTCLVTLVKEENVSVIPQVYHSCHTFHDFLSPLHCFLGVCADQV